MVRDRKDIDTAGLHPKAFMNEDIWKNNKMDIFVRRQLLQIAKHFLESFDVSDFRVRDIVMTGSLANYNWNENNSDIDLHIIVDFNDIDSNTKLVSAFFDELRTNWNAKHKGINVYGYPVEMYVQDASETHSSSGVYSILDDKWVVEPSIEKMSASIDDDSVYDLANDFMERIDDLEERYGLAADGMSGESMEDISRDASEIYKEIKNTRRTEAGTPSFELSTGNLAFKVLRRNGYIGKLIDIMTNSYDDANSIKR